VSAKTAARLVRHARSAYVSLGVALCAALGMCSVPLLGIHGAESALLLGVLLPPMAAFTAAVLVRRLRSQASQGLLRAFQYTLGFGALLWLLPVLVLALDGVRIRNCSPLEGLTFMLLGPGFGVALASLTGMFAALALPDARSAPLLAAAVPIATMLLAVLRFYAGPGIFAYGHFYGFFPGTLYDENVGLTSTFLSLRVETSLWILALCLGIASCTDPDTLELRWRPRARFGLVFGCAVACSLCGVAAELYSDQLGYTTSTEHVRATLGGELRSARCRVYFPREWSQRDRRRLASDCDFRVQRAEAWLGLRHSAAVDVYLFRSPSEKYALMGAETTNIAKPWRSEVYISDAGWPNPVLGHEVVHVVARGAGGGPLRIAGSLGGLWPNPALIEGVAVAAAWQPQGSLTPHEWAHAMLELGMIPPLRELFGAGFLGQQKRLAYTLSGSLLRFVQERWGQRAIRATYASGSLERGVGVPVVAIEAAWLEYLRGQPLTESALALARARFSGGGILSAVCPHTLAKLRDELRADLNAGDDSSAKQRCQRILTLDPADANTRVALATLLVRLGDKPATGRELAQLVHQQAPAPFIAAVKQAEADQALREGRGAVALARYEALLQEPLDDDQKRLLQVKALAAQAAASGGTDQKRGSGQKQAELLFELLVGAPGERADGATAVYLSRELRSLRNDGLPHYLEARQLFFQARFAHAARLLREARALGLPTPELRAEALRVEGICRIATGELTQAAELFRDYAQSGGAARSAEADDFLARIRFLATRPE
jgi:hypothetical protein